MTQEEEIAVDMICAKAADEIEKLRAEINEQARLLGISAEKELALRAKNERLKAELKSIDGALDDPRANLTLTTAEIIWELKAELAEKEAEILKLNQMYPATAYTVEIEKQLVSVTKERDEIAAQARMLDRMVEEIEKQLAAALAACDAKDTILRGITLYRAFNGDDWPAIEATQALAIKPDASALRQHEIQLLTKYNIKL